MKKTILLFVGLAFLTCKNQAQTVSDYDGNSYNTVTIGTQIWMKENLKVTHYQNGIAIPNVQIIFSTPPPNYEMWDTLSTGAMCYFVNDSASNASIYGALYNWYSVVDNRKLCPSGWHVPTDADWTTLTTYLIDDSVAGGKLKETGATHWYYSYCATNESNFTALPGGSSQVGSPHWGGLNTSGWWWSSTAYDIQGAWFRQMWEKCNVIRSNSNKKNGFSVRCVSDSTSGINNINYEDNNIQMYPNPAIDRIIIDCAERQVVEMQVFNLIGECIMQKVLKNVTNNIDISSLSKGIYLIKLSGANWTVNRQMTKL